MKKIFDITVPKDKSEASSNEDAFDYDYQKQVFALSDGASESYNSKIWSKILVREFVDIPNLSEEWILKCAKKYLKSLDLTNLTESQFIAFNKGSFATLITVQRQGNKISIFNVGDSHIFAFAKSQDNDTNSTISSKPARYIELFKKPTFTDNPTLISTKILNNSFIDFDNIEDSVYFKTLDLKYPFSSLTELHRRVSFVLNNSEPINSLRLPDKTAIFLICATDAVAEWIFKYIEANKTDKIFNFLLSLKEDKNKGKFEKTVSLCRKLKSMNIDDSTLAILECEYNHGLS